MKRIGIIGAGFSGTMTAVNLIRNSSSPVKIIIIDQRAKFNKGIAYSPFSEKLILNVIASKMSAFPDNPDHFLNWVMAREKYRESDRMIVSDAFLPRFLYGRYLEEIWQNALSSANGKRSVIREIEATVVSLDPGDNSWSLTLSDNRKINVDSCVIATGNNLPRNPDIKNTDFLQSNNYFQNPWDIKSVQNPERLESVLLIGNGLTMVDTVIGLLEQGFKNDIYTLSRNGFHTLPHRHNGFRYAGLTDEISKADSLLQLVKLVNKHTKILKEFGFSAEPVIDSLRPHTQLIWQKMSELEKWQFTTRLRYYWDTARHRIPQQILGRIQQLRFDDKLHVFSGKLIEAREQNRAITVTFYDKTKRADRELTVSRVINCSGPETDLSHVESSLLNDCLEKGLVAQDSLKLGIKADPETFRVFDAAGLLHRDLYTIGPPLKGVLWESIAVNELRVQAEKLSAQLLN